MSQDPDPTITLALPLSVVNLALTGLAELPAKTSIGAIDLIRQQTLAWLQVQQESAAAGAAQAPSSPVEA